MMKSVWFPTLLAVVLASFAPVATAAVKPQTEKTADKSAGAAKSQIAAEDAVAQRLTGRLPRYFASVVDARQRLEIYGIQASFRTKIAELESQLAALRQSEMEAIEGVLSASQRERLDELRARPVTRSKASGGTSSKSTAAPPAKTTARKTTARKKSATSPATAAVSITN